MRSRDGAHLSQTLRHTAARLTVAERYSDNATGRTRTCLFAVTRPCL